MIQASSGVSCSQNVKFSSGISAISGIKGTLPESYRAYYPFTSDFIDQVSGELVADFDNAPSFGGGGVNTVANTNLNVTTFTDKGRYFETPGQPGNVSATLSTHSVGDWDNGIQNNNELTFNNGISGVGDGKYVLTAGDGFGPKFVGTKIITVSGVAEITSYVETFDFPRFGYGVLSGDVATVSSEMKNPNGLTMDHSQSAFYPLETGAGSISALRTTAGDDVAQIPLSSQWDTSGDFRYGYIGIGKTVADITAQVLLQTGNMGITTGIGITFAEIGASISSLSVTSDTIVGECFLKYVNGMLSIVIDGVESTPVASAAPVIGAFSQAGANTSNALAAPGTYGGLLFEVL